MDKTKNGIVKDELKIEDIVIAITKKKRIFNATESVDDFTSLVSYFLYDSVAMIHQYMEQTSDITREDIMNKIVDVSRAYTLIEAGMDPDEAMEVIGLQGGEARYINADTGESITKEEHQKLEAEGK